MGRREDDYLELDDFFDGMQERNVEPAGRSASRVVTYVSSLLAFVLIVVIVPTAFALPVAVSIKAASDQVMDAWEAVPAEVPPIPSSLPGYTYVHDTNGGSYAQFYAENRQPVTYENVAPVLIDAIVAVEDRRFWEHEGVDGGSIVRAGRANFLAGNTVQGASTLTQQLVENLKLLDADTDVDRESARAQTMTGKLIEAKTALALEEQLTKEEILEVYMNVVYFGAGSYGVAAAADRFFGVPASDLTLVQAATIAGMVREPSGLDPFVNPGRAKDRRDTVLAAMRDVGHLTQWQFKQAIAEPLDTSNGNSPPNGCSKSRYPYYCALVREELSNDTRLGRTQAQRDANIAHGHLVVKTALDPKIMKAIDTSIKEAFTNGNRIATAVVVVEPGTGRVVGLGQNRSWGGGKGKTEIPYAASKFQPGSTFKAITLATAVEQGISEDTTFLSQSGYKPEGFDFPEKGFVNNGGVNLGTIDGRTATRFSSNVWFAHMITQTGVLPAVEMAKKMGVTASLDNTNVSERSASFSLGAWEVTPLEMASVYATIASTGTMCEPVFITDIIDTTTGQSLTTDKDVCSIAYTEHTARVMTSVLQQPFKKGGTAAKFPLMGHQAVGKTGTTDNHAAAWFVGATAQYSTAVWIGDPRGGQKYPLKDVKAYGKSYDRVFGADISGPLWNAVMTRVHEGLPNVKFSTVPQAQGPRVDLADLRTPPNITGMALGEAVSLLTALDYTVVVSSETSSAVSSGYVARSVLESGYIMLTVGAGTDRAILNHEVRATDGVLVIVDAEAAR